MTKTRLGLAVRLMSWTAGVSLLGWDMATTGCAQTAQHASGDEGVRDRAEAAPSCPSGMLEIPSGR